MNFEFKFSGEKHLRKTHEKSKMAVVCALGY